MVQDIMVEKKDGTREVFDINKVIKAVNKSARRSILRKFSDKEAEEISERVTNLAVSMNKDVISYEDMHGIIETTLEDINPAVCTSYKDYRNWRDNHMAWDELYQKALKIRYRGDKENSNSDSSLVSTKSSLIYHQYNKELYQKYFMTKEELEDCKTGWYYIHDMGSRLDTMNCCLFDISTVLTGGFEMGNMWYTEPKSLDTAFDVIGDIVLSAASQQYGGFTLPEIDTVLEKYAIKSYSNYRSQFITAFTEIVDNIAPQAPMQAVQIRDIIENRASEIACEKVKRDFEQGFQGWEYRFNTVASSRGDYPFITITTGLNVSKFGVMANEALFSVRKNGQGKSGFEHIVPFPKIVFLFDKNLHGPGKEYEFLFDQAIECSEKAMYPDYLSLTGEGYIASMYKKYKKVISPMGCRAFLSPWYERGGEAPADENDVPVFVGRWNAGAISLNLPMILAKAMEEKRDFYEVLDVYLEKIREIHQRTFEYLAEMPASINPLAFCEGGFYQGHLKPNEKIAPLLKYATASFGFTALNELQRLYNGKSISEDGQFALDVLKYINQKVTEFKKEDHILYAIYGTPAESLCGLQVKQFRKRFGIVEGVSDRAYVSNSFHCHVADDLNCFQKQDLEKRFWELANGGKIQYTRHPTQYNFDAMKADTLRAMEYGFYKGHNMALSKCDDCGYEQLDMDTCPKCGSANLTKIDRMNGYLSFSRVHGDTRLNDAKMAEIAERVSM